jgi:hypothetical protein
MAMIERIFARELRELARIKRIFFRKQSYAIWVFASIERSSISIPIIRVNSCNSRAEN